MAEKYALSWWPQFASEVTSLKLRMLTAEQLGAFFRLRADLWLEERLPDDDKLLAEITRTGKRWRQIKQNVTDLLVSEDGFWIDPELEKMRSEQLEKRDKRSKAGKIGADTRWENTPRRPDRDSNAMATASQTHADGMPEERKERKKENNVVYDPEPRPPTPLRPETREECRERRKRMLEGSGITVEEYERRLAENELRAQREDEATPQHAK